MNEKTSPEESADDSRGVLPRLDEIMSRDLPFCHEEDNCVEVLVKMDEHNLSILPVVDHEMRIVGLISHAVLAWRVRKAMEDHFDAGSVGM